MPLLACMLTVALLASLACFDVAQRRLPGKLVGAVALMYFIMAAFAKVSLLSIATHFGVALSAFLIGTLLFAAGMLGGGDVKFAAAVFLWAGVKFAMAAFILISLAGLIVALVALGAGWLARRAPAGALAGIASPWAAARGVPYGVAIAIGALPIVVARTLAGGMTL
ncbi:A24 family peptidase [Paraburkholderia oxyphila]|uniref:A24 family peptidase n=1 Tax=Paraburkholderia oxyphila TaxID=614212 RepID=UPI000487937B|nr:prepilin peptidase [Paraburkholderia oxyphila]